MSALRLSEHSEIAVVDRYTVLYTVVSQAVSQSVSLSQRRRRRQQ